MKQERSTLKCSSRILPQQLRQCGFLTISVGRIIGVAHMCSALTYMLLLILLCFMPFDEIGTYFLSTVCMIFMKCLLCNFKTSHHRLLLIVDIGTMYLTQYIGTIMIQQELFGNKTLKCINFSRPLNYSKWCYFRFRRSFAARMLLMRLAREYGVGGDIQWHNFYKFLFNGQNGYGVKLGEI